MGPVMGRRHTLRRTERLRPDSQMSRREATLREAGFIVEHADGLLANLSPTCLDTHCKTDCAGHRTLFYSLRTLVK